ncbi:hypothetical protein FQA39_LY02407 [Lamprigera yunnana]|nr:hypothetical protein FQA39_LY02407 [Lamprigera yunnana]
MDLIKNNLMENFAAFWFIFANVYGAYTLPFTLFFLLLINAWLIIAVVLYILCVWTMDKSVAEQGGRRLECVRNFILWRHLKNYFPVSVSLNEPFKLDQKRNYLFCYYSQGTIGLGSTLSFGTTTGGFKQLFPYHKPYIFSYDVDSTPVYRDYLLSLGFCKTSVTSINWVLSSKGGNAGMLVIEEPNEWLYKQSDHFFLPLLNKKGFVKLAIKSGSPLVPVIAFGDDVFCKFTIKKGSICKKIQQLTKALVNCGTISRSSLLPKKQPINIIVGKPVDIKKVSNPSPTEVEFVHKLFILGITELFEKHKFQYLRDPDNTHLVLC